MISPYITYREHVGGKNHYFVLQKEFPHYVAIITTMPVEGALVNQPVASYQLYLSFNGTLSGNYIPSYQDVYDEIVHVFFEMSNWFYAERVLREPKRYKKWKIQPRETI